MAKVLPFNGGEPFYRVSTTLEEVQYIFDVYWNGRDSAWYFDILEIDETPIRHGVKVVLGALLVGRDASQRLPDGVLIAVDTTGEGREATFDDFGERVIVQYIPDSELLG